MAETDVDRDHLAARAASVMGTAVERLRERVRWVRWGPPSEPTVVDRALLAAERWAPRTVVNTVVGHCRSWIHATPARRLIFWFLVIFLGLVVIPCIVGAIAMAHGSTAGTTTTSNTSTIDGIGWTGVRDSSGVPVADYIFATPESSFWHPGQTIVIAVLGLMFAGYMVISTTAIWLIGYALSFRWLDILSSGLNDLSTKFAGQIATPVMLAVCATVGATVVGLFVVRGYPAKAAVQVMTMTVVAVIGPLYLAHPLATVLGPNGVLVEGRNVGISVAAGLNGNTSPDASQIVSTMNGTLSDNLVRHPLQTWNFGQVVDLSPNCGSAWSAGVLSGDSSRLAANMQSCGDSAAFNKAENPSPGQIGTGVLLFIFSIILLFFGVYPAARVFVTAGEAVYHSFLAIVGFAGGALIYGPSQTFTVVNLVSALAAGIRMVAFTVWLGVWSLVLNDVFAAAPGAGIQVIFLAAIVLLVGASLLRRLNASLAHGTHEVAARLAGAVAGPAPSGAPVSGIGAAGATASMRQKTLDAINHGNWVNTSFLASQIFGMQNPLTAYARKRQRHEFSEWELRARGWPQRLIEVHEAYDEAAANAVVNHGGMTARGAAAALVAVRGIGGDIGAAIPVLRRAGFDEMMIANTVRAYANLDTAAEDNAVTYMPLARSAAALQLSAIHTPGPGRDSPDHHALSAVYRAQYLEAARRLERDAPPPDDPRLADRSVIDMIMHPGMTADAFGRSPLADHSTWQEMDTNTRRTVGRMLAEKQWEVAQRYMEDPAANLSEARRISDLATRLDLVTAGVTPGPWTN